jgi:hypothetical protein
MATIDSVARKWGVLLTIGIAFSGAAAVGFAVYSLRRPYSRSFAE